MIPRSLPFDPTYGYTIEELFKTPPAGPDDFDTFSQKGNRFELQLDYGRTCLSFILKAPKTFLFRRKFRWMHWRTTPCADPRFQAANLNIPCFRNHPLRVRPSPAKAAEKPLKSASITGKNIPDVLPYFDVITAASWIKIPVFVASATFDPCVPPLGQFAVYNALLGPKDLFLRQAVHFDLASNDHDDTAIKSRLIRWFTS